MSQKKRTKKYQGVDAKITKPIVKRYSVEDTSKFKRWWRDNKPEIIIRGVQVGGVIAISLLAWVTWKLVF